MRIQTGVTGCSRSSEAATHKKGQFGTLECGARRGGKAEFSSARQGNRAALPLTRRTSKATSPFTRRTASAVSAANACEGITCLRQVTRNDSDEAERSERSPPGVARNAGDEGLAAPGGQVSGEAAPASGSAPQPDRPPPPARGSGGRAQRPPEPSAGRQSRAHYPPGSLPVLALKNCYPPGTLPVLDVMQNRV